MYARALTVSPSSSSDWSIHSIDTAGNVGRLPSLAVLNGNPAVAYYTDQSKDLKFAQANKPSPELSSAWTIHTVDSSGTVGKYPSMAILSGYPAIAYYKNSAMELRFARAKTPYPLVAGDWDVHVIDLVGNDWAYASMNVLNARPIVSYFNEATKDLRYARALSANPASSTDWQIHDVDTLGDVGRFTSLCVIGSNPVISYEGVSENTLKYARALVSEPGSAADWSYHSVALNGSYWGFNDLAVLDGKPTVAYYDATAGDLNMAWALGAQPDDEYDWALQSIDSDTDVGGWVSTVSFGGEVFCAYYDRVNMTLKFSRTVN